MNHKAYRASMLRNNGGYTLVEVLIMGPILMVTIVLLMSYLFGQYGQLTQQGALINLQVEAQSAAFSMQDDVFFARSFESDKNANLVDNYQPSGGWKSNTTPPTLIISDLALTKNRRDPNRQPVYVNTVGCAPQSVLEQNDELFNNIIYFASGTNLYKRILSAPSSLATCGTSYQKQSCPAANASSACQADRLLSDKLNNFSITYYDSDNDVTTSPENAKKIKVDIQLKDRAFAEDIYSSSSITLKRLNQ